MSSFTGRGSHISRQRHRSFPRWRRAGPRFDVLADYAHTPNAFLSVLSDLRQRLGAEGRVIAVFGAAGNRDHAKRPELARIARQYTDYFIITNEDPFGEDAAAIIEEV